MIFVIFVFVYLFIINKNKKINNNDKKKSIGIIGCGPAGLMSALLLNDKGFNNITLYGDFKENQVNTLKYKDITVDTYACFLNTGYHKSVVKLCDRFNLNLSVIKTYSYNNNNNNNIISIVKNIYGYFVFLCFCIYYTINKFNNIFSVSANKFSEKYNMTWPKKNSFVNNQLYGYTNDVSAYHLFEWYKLSTIISFFLSMFILNLNNVFIITKGYETLFRRIFNSLKLKKYYNKKILKVYVENNKNILIDENNKKIYHDIVLVACPLNNIITPLYKYIDVNKDIIYTKIFTILFTSTTEYKNIGVYYLNNMKNEYNKIISFRYFGHSKKTNKYIFGCVGYANKYITKNNIINDIYNIKINVTDVLFWNVLNYNYRFSIDALKKGKHLLAEKKQGNDNIWYTTGPFTHWDIDSIYKKCNSVVTKINNL